MYLLRPTRAYVTGRVERDPRAVGRMNAMLSALGRPQVTRIGDDEVPDLIRRHDLFNIRKASKQIPDGTDPIVVFNALKLDGEPDNAKEILAKCPQGTPEGLVRRLLGFDCVAYSAKHLRGGELVCRRTHEFHTTDGCIHRCLYCPCAGEPVVNVALNVEEFIEKKLDPLVKANPLQKVFRYQTQAADSLCFEPEYGAIKTLVEYFAGLEDRYLLTHTKSANTDFMRALDHKGHTIALWSLTSDTVSREIERRTGTATERIEAARRLQDAGYQVRFKFKPIVPIRNWRAECSDMIRRVFEATQPDVISLCVLMWMKVKDLEEAMPADLLDPEHLKAAREQAETVAKSQAGPFPHPVRAQIYGFFVDEIRKHDKHVPISLSTETLEMWREFKDRLGVGPGHYVCGCGPQCTPRLKRLGEDVLKEEVVVQT